MENYLAETGRLRLRPLELTDLDDLYEIFGNPECMRYYPSAKSKEETKEWIEWSKGLFDSRGIGFFAVELKENREFVGECGLTPQLVDGIEEIEIGYHVKKHHWRKGFAGEAARACKDYAFNQLGLNRVISLVRPENKPSAGVAINIGMKKEKEIVKWELLHTVYSVANGQKRT